MQSFKNKKLKNVLGMHIQMSSENKFPEKCLLAYMYQQNPKQKYVP